MILPFLTLWANILRASRASEPGSCFLPKHYTLYPELTPSEKWWLDNKWERKTNCNEAEFEIMWRAIFVFDHAPSHSELPPRPHLAVRSRRVRLWDGRPTHCTNASARVSSHVLFCWFLCCHPSLFTLFEHCRTTLSVIDPERSMVTLRTTFIIGLWESAWSRKLAQLLKYPRSTVHNNNLHPSNQNFTPVCGFDIISPRAWFPCEMLLARDNRFAIVI